jgi:protein arginine N-methyltransferase 2
MRRKGSRQKLFSLARASLTATTLAPKFRLTEFLNVTQNNDKMEMFEDDPLKLDVDLTVQSLLLAAANHDISALKDLLKTTPASVQDSETGFTPLHAAIAACEAPEEHHMNGDSEVQPEDEQKRTLEAAAETVRLLLQSGAIWNDLDNNNETPGCIARKLGLEEIYQLIVDAGVRAELLLSRLDEYQLLGNAEESDEDEEDEEATQDATAESEPTVDITDVAPEVKAETVTSNTAYLEDQVAFTDTTLLDSTNQGVMMSWETPIMERHASLLLPQPGLRVLNVGHGMGIIDKAFQSHSPASHHIIEAHPNVIANMHETGWFEKPNVVIHEGRWQDVLPKLVMGGEDGSEILFDAIYFDTFAEEYKALKEFFSEWAVQLLDSDGRLSFFNGMGADRQVCYDVYTKVRLSSVNLDNYQMLIKSRLWKWICMNQVSTLTSRKLTSQIFRRLVNGKESTDHTGLSKPTNFPLANSWAEWSERGVRPLPLPSLLNCPVRSYLLALMQA